MMLKLNGHFKPKTIPKEFLLKNAKKNSFHEIKYDFA